MALSLCAWAGVTAMLLGEGVASAGPGHGALWWCASGGVGAMPAMGSGAGLPASLAEGMPMWAAMSWAMMVPATFPAVGELGAAVGGFRRQLAVTRFLGGYLLVWATFGAFALTLAAIVGGAERPVVLAASLGIAASWQLTRGKQRSLLAARQRLLPSSAQRGPEPIAVFRRGLANGAACLGSCWAVMLVMTLADSERLLWMVALSALVLVEHRARNERRAIHGGAGMLGVAALLTLAIG